MNELGQIEGLFEAVRDHAARHPSAPAVVHRVRGETEVTTYARLVSEAGRFAARFEETTPPNSVIPMYVSKSATCIAAMLGALASGRAFACLNKKLRTPQLSAVVRQTRAPVALIDGPGAMLLGRSEDLDPPLLGVAWWLVSAPELHDTHRKAATALRERGLSIHFEPSEIPTSQPEPPGRPRGVGCCLFTSGSTGQPKGVLISAQDLDARARAEVQFFELERDDVLLSILPFSFDVGLNQLLSGLRAGCSLVILDSWLPADVLAATKEHRVTGISGVPSIWQDMLDARLRFDTTGDHRALRYITASGGDLAPHQLERLPELAPGCGIYKTYGQTEAFRPTALRPEEFDARKRSVGRPFASARVYVVDERRRCEPGEVGEVVHTGLGTMMGYLDGEDPQRKLRPNPFRGSDDDAPLAVFTGDLGYFDSDGYLFLEGRRDSMLKVEGNRVYPHEISGILVELESVREAQVVGVRDDAGKMKLVAFVVAGTKRADPERLRRELRDKLPSYMLPHEFVVVDAIPRTASGKPDVPALLVQADQLVRHHR